MSVVYGKELSYVMQLFDQLNIDTVTWLQLGHKSALQ